MIKPNNKALWASQVLLDCLQEAGDDVDAGFAAAEYILSTEEGSYDYPRNKSNQFLSKLVIAEASRDDTKYKELRDSLPEDQCWKLDSKVSILQGGGTVHHPSESPGLGVNIHGVVVDPQWAARELDTKAKEEWDAREADRAERRKLANRAVRSFRAEYRPLARIDSLLKRAGATPAEMRSLSRFAYELKTEVIDQKRFDELYEGVMESVHTRIDEECRLDHDPTCDPFPLSTASPALSVDRRGVSHREGGAQGGQFVQRGQEGSRGQRSDASRTGRQPTATQRATRQPTQHPTTADTGSGATPVERGSGPVQVGTSPTSEPVASAPAGPSDDLDDQAGQDPGVPPGDTATEAIPRAEFAGVASLANVNRRIDRYSEFFRGVGDEYTADWLDLVKEHINEVGPSAALESFGEEKRADIGEVSYSGTGYFEPSSKDAKSIASYLARAGIAFQSGDEPVEGTRTIASYPIPESERHKYKPGDVIPGTTTFKDKLEEAKHLPGLESTEDIDIVAGAPVTQLTSDVVSKFDAKYGKGGWIVKSYGDEAYAGFGIFFPQYVERLKQDARNTTWSANKRLMDDYGLKFSYDDAGKIAGVTDGTTVTPLGSENHPVARVPQTTKPNVVQYHINMLLRKSQKAQANEMGPVLPRSSESNLYTKTKISLDKDEDGKVVGIVDPLGYVRKLGSVGYKKFIESYAPEHKEFIEHEIERAVQGIKDQIPEGGVKYMVSPAFAAVGVDDAERAVGRTWETSTEGRVHIACRDGKATAVPYATLASRSDAVPAVFYNDDLRAMERAAVDAINALPESERNSGQVYAPDVMKSEEGWKVVEGNAAVDVGSSLWLERNPMVMDAYVSHITGRDPMHVGFIRNLLQERMRSSRISGPTQNPRPAAGAGETGGAGGVRLSTDQPRRAAGTRDGGQWVRRGQGPAIDTLKYGKSKVTYSRHKSPKIDGPSIALTNYKQQDVHSCGFVAVLTIAKHLKPRTTAREVLKATRPSINYGVDRFSLIKSLESLGVNADYRKDLTVAELRKLVESGTPVIVSVWPDEWPSDHWTIVRGFDAKKVYLTNHKNLPIDLFEKQWSDMDMRGRGGSAEGIACTVGEEPADAALATEDVRGVEHRGKGSSRGGQFVQHGAGEGDVENFSDFMQNDFGDPVDLGPDDIIDMTGDPNDDIIDMTSDPSGVEPVPEEELGLEEEEFKREQGDAALFNSNYTPEDIDSIEALVSFYPEEQQEVARNLMYGKSTVSEKLTGGVNNPWLLTLEDGNAGVFKDSLSEAPDLRSSVPHGTYWKREIASSLIAHAIGFGDLVPVTVPRKAGDSWGSMQAFIDNASTAHEYRNATMKEEEKYGSNENLARAALFDYILLAGDRHLNNWLVTSPGTQPPTGIDVQNAIPKDEPPQTSPVAREDLSQTGPGVPVVDIPPGGIEPPTEEVIKLIDNGLTLPDRHAEYDFQKSALIAKSITRGLPTPDVSYMKESWPRIEAIMRQCGLEDAAITQTKRRFEWATSGEAKTIADLRNPFGTKTGKNLKEHMKYYALLEN